MDESLVIHETTPPTNGVAHADVTAIPPSNDDPVVATIANAAAAASASATRVAQLAQTGGRSQGQVPVLPAAIGAAILTLLLGITVWMRRAC